MSRKYRGLSFRFPLIGRLVRRRAAQHCARSAAEGNTQAVRVLIELLCSTRETAIREIAARALSSLSSTACINIFCSKWAETRESLLEEILLRARYVAEYPLGLRVLTAAKVGDIKAIERMGDLAVEHLIGALGDQDPQVAACARSALLSLADPRSAEIFHRYALQTADPALLAIAKQKNTPPEDAADRALFYFLTEQWEAFEELDWRPNRPLLNEAYARASEPARRALFEVARRSGRPEAAALVAASGRRRLNARSMRREQWEAILGALKRDGRLEELWRFSFIAPLPLSAEAIRVLRDSAFKPEEHERELFSSLAALCPPSGPVAICPGKLLHEAGPFADSVENLSTSPNGTYLAACVRQSARVFAFNPFRLLATLKAPTWSISLACITPDERLLVTAGKDRIVRLWSLPGGRHISSLKGHRDWISCMAVEAGGALLATGGKDSTVRLWNLPSGTLRGVLPHGREGTDQSWVLCLRFVPHSNMLVTGSKDSAVRLWDLSSTQRIKTLDGHRLGVLAVEVSADGRFLATGCKGGILQFWSIPEGRRLARYETHPGGVSALVISPDGALVASGGHDGVVQLWDAVSLERTARLEAHSGAVVSLVIAPDGSTLASASSDGTICLWRLPSATLLSKLGDQAPVQSLSVGLDGRVLVSGGQDKRIRLWHLSYLEPLALATHRDLEAVRHHLRDNQSLPAEEKRSWEFLEALLQGKFRYDILVDRPVVAFEPYDIEIETKPTNKSGD